MNQLSPSEQTAVHERPEDFSSRTVVELELETIGSKEFAQSSSKYVHAAFKYGKTIIITNRGTPMAQLGPVHPRITADGEQK